MVWCVVVGLEIEVRRYKDINLRDGVVVDGFPSVGLVSSISASYLIAALQLDQIAVLDSPHFPPISLIFDGKPKFPARIHASEKPKLAVFSAEFTPNPALDRALAKKILSWSKDHYCRMIVTIVGRPVEEAALTTSTQDVVAVGSTERARRLIEGAGLEQMKLGMITGIPGTLLNEGRWENFDVVALVVKAREHIADATAAVKALTALCKLVPDISLDITPLAQEAEKIEARLRVMRKEVATVQQPLAEIYR